MKAKDSSHVECPSSGSLRFLLRHATRLRSPRPYNPFISSCMKKSLCLWTLALPLACTMLPARAQQNPTPNQPNLTPTAVCVRCIRAHMDFLASDALRGRGSGTGDELVAATYIASQFEQYGVEPAGDAGGYLQRATVIRYRVAAPPRLTFHSGAPSPTTTWIHGREFLALELGEADVSGPLEKFDPGRGPSVRPGAFVFVTRSGSQSTTRQLAFQLMAEGARAVIVSQ